ncbi:MAG: ABC transporter permease [Candidatus Krumholzibacteria bacterium]|nr:ABC transporter permease [Candidatus Krumholzibacteria bacterium]
MTTGNWWKIARLELVLAARDKESVIWSLLAPVLMAWVFGNAFGSGPPQPTSFSIDRGQNPAFVETAVAGMLEAHGLTRTDSEKAARVVLPDSLLHRIAAGRAIDVRIIRRDASDLRARQLSAKTREAIYTMAFRARPEWRDAPPSDEDVAALARPGGPLRLESRALGRARVNDGVVHQLPAMLVMFILFQMTTFFMILWIQDLQSGKIKRIVMSPTPIRELFAGVLASRLLWGALQVIVILGGGSLLLGVRLEIPWGHFAIVLAAYMTTAAALGLLLGTFFRTLEKANAIGVIVGLFMAALGGCWWPLEVISNDAVRNAALALPTGLMMDAMGEFLALGPEAPFPFLNFILLALMSAVMMPLAIHRMRRQIVS